MSGYLEARVVQAAREAAAERFTNSGEQTWIKAGGLDINPLVQFAILGARAAQLAFTGLPRGIDRYADPMGRALSVDYARAWGMLQALRKLKETSEKPAGG